MWKAAQAYLRVVEGLDIASPKGVVRSCRELGLLTEAETVQCLKMADDRNLTVHTYNEPLALAIYERILGHMDRIGLRGHIKWVISPDLIH